MNSGAASSGNELAAIATFCGIDDAGNAGEHEEREAGEPHRRVDRRPEEQRHEPDGEDQRHAEVVMRAAADGAASARERSTSVEQRVEADGDRRERHDRVDNAEGEEQRHVVDVAGCAASSAAP